jgi:transcriptional regulator with XRE-family HTH domain
MPDYRPRIRAARLWADLTQQQLADELGVDVQTIKRRENDRASQPKRGERLAIAAICGVPPEFLEEGFGGHAESEISERLAGLAEQVRYLTRELSLRDMEEREQTGESGQQDEAQ